DPSRKSISANNPQTWSRYAYCYNSPMALIDKNGKWPTDTHNLIIQTAFNRINTKAIERGSERTDIPGTILEKNAYKHAMTPGGWVKKRGLAQARADATTAAEKFIHDNLTEAKRIF